MYRTEQVYIPAQSLSPTCALCSSWPCPHDTKTKHNGYDLRHPPGYKLNGLIQAANLTLDSWFKRTRRLLFPTVQELPLLFRIAPDERGQDAHKKMKGGGDRQRSSSNPCNRPWRLMWLWNTEVPTFFYTITSQMAVRLSASHATCLLSPGRFLVEAELIAGLQCGWKNYAN
jgi:hypothetical protein